MSSYQNFVAFLTSLMRAAFPPISLSLRNVPKNLRVKLFCVSSKLLFHLQEILGLFLCIGTINCFLNYPPSPSIAPAHPKKHDTNLEWYFSSWSFKPRRTLF
jgi:hypothetical protein